MVVLLAAFPDSIATLARWIRFPQRIEFTFLVPLYGYRANYRPVTVASLALLILVFTAGA